MNFKDKLDNYLQEVCSEIKMKKSHDSIKLELENHILDQKEDYLKNGLDENLAGERAIIEMGNGRDLGKSLNELYKTRINYGVLILPFILMAIGIFFFYKIDPNQMGNTLLYILISTVGLYLGFKLDYTLIFKNGRKLYLVLITLSALEFIYKSQKNIFDISIFSILIPIVLLSVFSQLKDEDYSYYKGLIYLIIPVSIFLYISKSSLVIYLVTSMLVYYRSFRNNKGFKLKFVLLNLFLIGLSTIYISSSPYRFERVKVMLNPSRSPYEAGYISILMKRVYRESGLLEGVEHLIPTIDQQFTISYIVGKMGKIYGIILLSTTVYFLYKISKNRRAIKNNFARELNLIIITLFAIQYCIYISNNLGILVWGHMKMPFVTYDLLYNWVNMFLVGLLLSTFNLDLLYKNKNIQVG